MATGGAQLCLILLFVGSETDEEAAAMTEDEESQILGRSLGAWHLGASVSVGDHDTQLAGLLQN